VGYTFAPAQQSVNGARFFITAAKMIETMTTECGTRRQMICLVHLVYLVSLVCLVYLVCLVCLVFWLNETNQINQIHQTNKTNQTNQPGLALHVSRFTFHAQERLNPIRFSSNQNRFS